MNTSLKTACTLAFLACIHLPIGHASAQQIIIDPPIVRPTPPHPHRFPPHHGLEVKSQQYATRIVDGVAVTNVDQVFHNGYPQQIEGTYLYPVPAEAIVSGFSMFVDGKELKGEVLDKESARRTYEQIVSKLRDPALLEYVGSKLYRARIFPIPANGDVRVTLQYTENLSIDAGMVDLALPFKGDARCSQPAGRTGVVVDIRSQTPIKNVFSPTHNVSVNRKSDHEVSVSYETKGQRHEHDFRLSYLLSDEEFGLALLSYHDTGEDGYFMARLAPEAKSTDDRIQPKDIAFVIDTSGSMSGEKIQQARDALKFCVANLNPGDRFNIIPFSHEPQPFKQKLTSVSKETTDAANAFIDKLKAAGGTNINDALLLALRSAPAASADQSMRPHMIVFLTDGMPTVGVTDTDQIIKYVGDANATRTRLFAFGVGYDVNTKLLDRLAESNHGTRTYVTPGENIEIKVSSFYRKVADPVLADLRLTINDLRTYDMFPRQLPDLFGGGEIVVVGRYEGDGMRSIELQGSRAGRSDRFVFERKFADRDTSNDFLPRLWAMRKVGYLLDEIRLHGDNDELKTEVVRLAKLHGIVTPYTSYLVTEDDRLAASGVPARRAAPQARGVFLDQFRAGRSAGVTRAKMDADTGAAAVTASQEAQILQSIDGFQGVANGPSYGYQVPFPPGSARAGDPAAPQLRQVGSQTFYLQDKQWVAANHTEEHKTKEIKLYSEEYFELLRKHPDVAPILAMGQRIIFQIGTTWYETVPPAEG